MYASCLSSMLFNDDIVNIKKPDGMCSPTFVVDEFSGLFYIYQSFLLNIQDMHKKMLLYQIFDVAYFSVFRRHYNITKSLYFHIRFHVILCCGHEDNSTIKITITFDITPFNNAGCNFTANNFILLRLESLKE